MEIFVKSSINHSFNQCYSGENLDRIAFPMGGIGAGMISLSGTGSLTQLSLQGIPDIHYEPYIMSALYIKGEQEHAKVLEGEVPNWRMTTANGPSHLGSGNGGPLKTYGLPRFKDACFTARFPFAEIELSDEQMPLDVKITGWSPFIPNDEDASSLPVAALEYTFKNKSDLSLHGIYSFHCTSILTSNDLVKLVLPVPPPSFSVATVKQGIMLKGNGTTEEPWAEKCLCAFVEDENTCCDYTWFRGDNPLDPMVMLWRNISNGNMPQNPPVTEGYPSMGGSIYVPIEIPPNGEKTVTLKLAWFTPITKMKYLANMGSKATEDTSQECSCKTHHKPWYAGVFNDVEKLMGFWDQNYFDLRTKSECFSSTFNSSTLAPEVLEAVSANLSILKSPTVLRQTDGRIWAYEGCYDEAGCCAGSCTHVWNYAQAIPHLFPRLERSLRQTEFQEGMNEQGHQQYRVNLPISTTPHDFHSAADGQLGGIMKVFREWRISGDHEWLNSIWPKVKLSLDYCIETWDPRHTGTLEEPHHNTYDIEFWGPDSMTTTIYLGALKAACLIGAFLKKDTTEYDKLFQNGRFALENDLWNGEYFFQKIRWMDLNAEFPPTQSTLWSSKYRSPESMAILDKEGPKYQYGSGCLSDGILGAWFARVCGIGSIIDPVKEKSHLNSVYKYNFRKSLAQHANPARSTYASGKEGGLLLCTWPHGGEPTLPFFYAFEVWTGIEYQVASHLCMMGQMEKGLEIVRTCRSRYDGRVRNPFDEIECGHWYARAMSSFGLLQGISGVRFDAVEKTLYIAPTISQDFQCFISTATGYGLAGIKEGKPFCEVKSGYIEVNKYVIGMDEVNS